MRLPATFVSGLAVMIVLANVNVHVAEASAQIMTAEDIVRWPSPPADARIAYGDDPLQFGELRLPEGEGPHPTVILIHGGCWLAEYDVTHIGKLAAALTGLGYATWTLEYRRVGNPGGGWPGTLEDVARGADHLRVVARQHPIDLDRVVAAGHSAGGHLALWLAGRHGIPRDAELYDPHPIALNGVLALAPAPDLQFLHAEGICGDVVDALMGGAPAEHPERYRQGSVVSLVPLDVPQRIVLGEQDTSWTPVGLRYFEAARNAGDAVKRIDAAESGHFEMIDPDSTTWPLVRRALGELFR